ncbi:MAG: hypothetical protein QM682_13535 [Paracoccus sp. (in: a-proteobacteria)]|uniref:hypothetical protein n=1 Tax=Paracoccus sp. TaxID=267 RepID=UPI0039E6ADAA
MGLTADFVSHAAFHSHEVMTLARDLARGLIWSPTLGPDVDSQSPPAVENPSNPPQPAFIAGRLAQLIAK